MALIKPSGFDALRFLYEDTRCHQTFKYIQLQFVLADIETPYVNSAIAQKQQTGLANSGHLTTKNDCRFAVTSFATDA